MKNMSEKLSPPIIDPQAQLEKLELQRRALEQLLKATCSAENLRLGLETTLLLGKPTGHSSEKAMAIYRLLDEKTKNLSNSEINLRLQGIEKNLKRHLLAALSYLERLESDEGQTEGLFALDDVQKSISDFRRSSQTMVALQVLLNLRGLPVTPRAVSLSQEVLQEKLERASVRERACRRQVMGDTLAMEEEIRQLLARDQSSDVINSILKQILQGLQANRRHLEAGLNIQDLPHPIESMVLTEVAREVAFEKNEDNIGAPKKASHKLKSIEASEKAYAGNTSFWGILLHYLWMPCLSLLKRLFARGKGRQKTKK